MPNAPSGATGEAMPSAGTPISTLSAEEIAAFNFEPWIRNPEDRSVLDGVRELRDDWIPLIPLADSLMYKTKRELVEFVNLHDDAVTRLADDFETAGDKFKALSELMISARSRLFVAIVTAVVEIGR